MKWQHVQENLRKDPWLKYVLFHSEIVRLQMPDESLQRNIVECNVTHLMFRGSTESLRIDSRPVSKEVKISSTDHCLVNTETLYGDFDDFRDHLGYDIGYYVVIQAFDPEEILITHLSRVPDKFNSPPSSKSIRWACVEQGRKIHRPLKWVAVVRNVRIVSQGDYLMNGYDVFKFPEGFTPFRAGWHLKASAGVTVP